MNSLGVRWMYPVYLIFMYLGFSAMLFFGAMIVFVNNLLSVISISCLLLMLGIAFCMVVASKEYNKFIWTEAKKALKRAEFETKFEEVCRQEPW